MKFCRSIKYLQKFHLSEERYWKTCFHHDRDRSYTQFFDPWAQIDFIKHACLRRTLTTDCYTQVKHLSITRPFIIRTNTHPPPRCKISSKLNQWTILNRRTHTELERTSELEWIVHCKISMGSTSWAGLHYSQLYIVYNYRAATYTSGITGIANANRGMARHVVAIRKRIAWCWMVKYEG